MRTRLVVKLVVVLVLLLTVVLYQMNDFSKREKLSQAEKQVRNQIVSAKTSVSSQITTIRKVLSSYEVDIKENQINWVQLDPFFAIARLQKKNDGSFAVSQFVGRSGTLADRWNSPYLEKALAVRNDKSDKSIQAKIFKDRSGNKYLTLIFNADTAKPLAVVGSADYFQKYFDIDRGGRLTAALMTSDQMLVAHSESNYIATLTEEAKLSNKKYIIQKEEIAGTNLIALSYVLKSAVAPAWMISWSVVGLIFGFGMVLIGFLLYGLEPLEKKIERFKKQEREAIFHDVVQSELRSQTPLQPSSSSGHSSEIEITAAALTLVDKTKVEAVERAQQAFAEPVGELAEATLAGPLQQAAFNLNAVFKQAQIMVQKDFSTGIVHSFYYGQFIKAFENILRNSIEALETKVGPKKITIRAYDVDDTVSVIEIQDNGVGLNHLQTQKDKVWQPFFTTKSKTQHMGLGLTESLSILRRCGADLVIESLPQEGALVKMVMRKEKNETIETQEYNQNKISVPTAAIIQPLTATQPADSTVDDDLHLDLDKVLALDDEESENLFSTQKINLKSSVVSNKTSAVKMPEFRLEKKTYHVDQLKTPIRRPEKT